MFEIFNQGWFESIIGLLGFIVGVIGLILYLNSRTSSIPTCQFESLHLLGKKEQELPPEVEIFYKKKEVQRLTLTKVYFWNAGKKMMSGDQVVEEDPLRCEFRFDPPDEILKAHVATSTNRVNKVTVSEADNQNNILLIDFDYLNSKDGVRIDILHTGKDRYPDIKGSLRGIPQGVSISGSVPKAVFGLASLFYIFALIVKRTKVVDFIYLFFGTIFLVMGVLPKAILKDILLYMSSNSVDISEFVFRLMLFMTGGICLSFPTLKYFAGRKKYISVLDDDEAEKDKDLLKKTDGK
jgi:hypothetical protein